MYHNTLFFILHEHYFSNRIININLKYPIYPSFTDFTLNKFSQLILSRLGRLTLSASLLARIGPSDAHESPAFSSLISSFELR